AGLVGGTGDAGHGLVLLDRVRDFDQVHPPTLGNEDAKIDWPSGAHGSASSIVSYRACECLGLRGSAGIFPDSRSHTRWSRSRVPGYARVRSTARGSIAASSSALRGGAASAATFCSSC